MPGLNWMELDGVELSNVVGKVGGGGVTVVSGVRAIRLLGVLDGVEDCRFRFGGGELVEIADRWRMFRMALTSFRRWDSSSLFSSWRWVC